MYARTLAQKNFSRSTVLNTDLPDQCLRMRKSEKDLELLDEDSTDIYKQNIIDKYIERPLVLNSMCLALFVALYYSSQKYPTDVERSDAQPSLLTD